MIEIGRMNKRIHLQKVTRTVTADGYTDVWVTYATVQAAVVPATPSAVARFVSTTIQTAITHLVTIWHRTSRLPHDAPGSHLRISVADRVLYGTRALYIAEVQNPEESNRQLILACEERAA